MSAYPSTTTAVDTSAIVARSQGNKEVFKISKTFDLNALFPDDMAANADIFNLFTLPANHVVLATKIKTTVIAVGCSGTCTAKLRFGTTDISGTADILTTATATGGSATTALPLNNGTSATLVNLVMAIGGGTTTTNPTIKVDMIVCDMS